MPIALSRADVAGLSTFGRNIFVADAGGNATPALLTACREVEGVVVPPVPGDLFGGGLDRVLHNYLAGMHVGYGLSGLTDETTFLLAVRALADSAYEAVGDGRTVVDASVANTPLAHVIQAVYPDAVFVVVDPPAGPSPAPQLLTGPHVLRLSTADVADRTGLVERLAAACRAAASHARPAPPAAALTLPGRPVFVVGCPRSGTTWLQHMLAAHPATGGPRHETAMFSSVRGLVDNRALHAWIGRDELFGALRRFCEGLLARCMADQAPDATRLIEKTPHHALHLDLVTAMFPDASIVGIHRDGRDVVRSLLEIEFGTQSAAVAAEGWLQSTRAVREFASQSTRTRDERYEELLAEPVGRVSDLMRWLDLRVDDSVFSELRARAGTRVSQHGTTGEVGSGKWRDIAPAHLRTIYRIAGDQLVALGYMTAEELAAVRRDPAYIAAAAAARLKAQAKPIARYLRAARRR
jgi:hypothetical protein